MLQSAQLEGPPMRGAASPDRALFCTTCGTGVAASARFCGGCGTAQHPPSEPLPVVPDPADDEAPTTVADVLVLVDAVPPRPPAPERTQVHAIRPRAAAPSVGAGPSVPDALTDLLRPLPDELKAVCGLMAAGGLLLLWPVLRALPATFELFREGTFGVKLGFLLLSLLTVMALSGGACLLVAWRLAHADRVARGLAYVLLAGVGAALLLSGHPTTATTCAMLACLGSLAVLILSPAVDRFFTAAAAPEGDQPVPVVVARTLIAAWAGCVGLVGAMWLPLGGLDGKLALVGLALVGLGVAAVRVGGRLAHGDRQARLLATAGAVANVVLLLAAGRRDAGALLLLVPIFGVVGNLWLPAESHRFFAGRSIA